MIIEKLQNGTKAVERTYNLANTAGVDVIKVTWATRGDSVAELFGLEIPNPVLNENVSNMVEDEIDELVSFEVGTVYFYPDSSSVRWGYILATERNLEVLAEGLQYGVYKIRSKDYAEKIKNIAVKKGLRTEAVKQEHESIVVTEREKIAETKRTQAEEELLETRRKLAEMEERAKNLEIELVNNKLEKPTVPFADNPDENTDDQTKADPVLNPVEAALGASRPATSGRGKASGK